MSTKETNPKDAIGCKKPPMSVLPWPVLYEVGVGMLEGACKYRRHNYRRVGVRASIYFDATMRHMALWWEGEDLDPDSGLSHITKAIAGLVVLRDAQMRDMVTDDRPPRFDNDPGRIKWMELMQDKVDNVLAKYPKPLPPHVELKETEYAFQKLDVPPGGDVGRFDSAQVKDVKEEAVKAIFQQGPPMDGQRPLITIEKEESGAPVSDISARALNKDDVFTCREGTFKVTEQVRDNDAVYAVERLADGSYARDSWLFPGNYRVEFKGAGK